MPTLDSYYNLTNKSNLIDRLQNDFLIIWYWLPFLGYLGLYIDGLLTDLASANVGRNIGRNYVGALEYADDLVITAPYLCNA